MPKLENHYVISAGRTAFSINSRPRHPPNSVKSRLTTAMEFSEQWKSLFPVGMGIGNHLVCSKSGAVGPLFFNPDPKTLSHIFSSTCLLPNLHLPPCLSPSRFLLSSDPSSILPSIASSITSHHDCQNDHNDTASYFLFNRIQLLNYPNRPSVLIFFPTGANDDEVGFFMLSTKDSNLHLQLDDNGDVFRATFGSSHRILRISVNPVAHSDPVIGYLLASTLYSVRWFLVRHDSILDRPIVSYVGGKVFKTCPVAHVCWSPHVLEESLILLENGDLFLFVLKLKSSGFIKGTRLRVPWSDSSENKVVWLSCEFGWNSRILIVARSDAIFLVDLRLKECNVSFLLTIESLRMYAPYENEQFLALSRAGPDNYHFAVASSSLLLLCDAWKPMMPVLQWVHGIDRPYYINVLSLSRLRSHSREDTFKLASDSGFCIILGSFWNCEFNLFCYGSPLPFRKGSIAFELSKIDATVCAWELPSEINLSGRDCPCGSCLLTEDFAKDALPEWIDRQLKKEMVFGFCILSNDLAALLCEPDEHGGFTMIRLMSSGKLELQRYHSSWALARNLDACHGQELCLDRHVMCPMGDEKYKFPKTFHYLKLDYFSSYAKGNLTRFLTEKLENTSMDPQTKEPPFAAEVHEFLCEKLNACQFGRLRSCPASYGVFKDVNLPTSFHEVTLRRLWADLPLELLQLAFLKYSACREVVANQNRAVALEFLALPDLPQLPPFCLRKTSPHGSDDIVGPVIPLSVLLVLNEFRNRRSDLEESKFSVEAELGLKYNEVMQVAGEISVSSYGSTKLDNHDAVSLADDGEETWVGSSKPKSFFSYRPVAFNCSATDLVQENSVYGDKIYDTFIFHVPEKKSSHQAKYVGQEIFDDLCPIELRFDAPVKKFEPRGLKAYNLLKRQMSKWQGGFDSYKEFCIQSGFEKAVNRCAHG